MNLRDRLSQLIHLRTSPPGGASIPGYANTLHHPLNERTLPGREITTEAGCCHELRASFPSHYRHGTQTIGDLFMNETKLLATLARDAAIGRWSMNEALFLDTETTGLSGGTGMVAFLVGVGWFEEDEFVLHQLFMRDYDEEEALLLRVGAALQEKKFLVTFNGKAFDLNLLTTRFIMHRLPLWGEDMPHVDLLHAARRLVGHRLADRSLGSLERSLLGIDRGEDIPGAEIPALYFRWLRERDPRLMEQVFRHNRYDILSLLSLGTTLAALLDHRRVSPAADPSDLLAASRLWASCGAFTKAIPLLEELCTTMAASSLRKLALRDLSLLYRRLGKMDQAVPLWEELLRDEATDVFALLELAKWHEHHTHNLAAALDYTCQALKVTPHSPEIIHRRQRLERRLGLSR